MYKKLLILSILFSAVVVNAQWTQIALPTVTINCLTASSDGTVLFAGTNNSGIYSTTNNGDSWQRKDNGVITASCNAINTQAFRNNAYLAGTDVGFCVSSDAGNTWVYPTTVTGITDPHINSVSYGTSSSRGDIYLGTNSGIFYIQDKTSTFKPMNSGLPSNSKINALALVQLQSEYFLCGTDNGVYIFSTQGSMWSRTAITKTVNSILGGAGNANVASDIGLYMSNNPSSFWSSPHTDAAMKDLNFLSMCFTGVPGKSFIWVGTGTLGKIYKSTNSGGGWFDVSNGLLVTQVKCLAAMGDYLIAGTDDGIWRRAMTQLTSVEDKNNSIPTAYSLAQNYPNPFNPTTTINFSVPKTSLVNLKVYDLLGREVSTLVNENKPTGIYSVQFNANKLVSGIYFYRMQAGDFVQTKKLILLK